MTTAPRKNDPIGRLFAVMTLGMILWAWAIGFEARYCEGEGARLSFSCLGTPDWFGDDVGPLIVLSTLYVLCFVLFLRSRSASTAHEENPARD